MVKKLIYLCSMALIALSVTGCMGKKEMKLENYVFDTFPVEFAEEEEPYKMTVYGNCLYYTTEQYPEYPDEYYDEIEEAYNAGKDEAKLIAEIEEKYSQYRPKINLWKCDLTTMEKTSLYEEISDSLTIRAFGVLEDDSVLMLCTEYIYNEDEDSYNEEVNLIKVDSAGGRNVVKDLNEYIHRDALGEENEDTTTDITGAVFDSDGVLYMNYEVSNLDNGRQFYNKINKDGELIGTVQVDGTSSAGGEVVIDDNGMPVVGDYEEDELCYRAVDFENNMLTDKLWENSAENENRYYELIGSSDAYGLILRDQTYMYSYDDGYSEPVPVLKWLDCGVVGDNVLSVVFISDKEFICSVMDSMDGSMQVGIMKEAEDDGTDKEVITLASQYMDTMLQQNVIAFNKASDKYKIDYIIYEDTYDSEESIVNDIIAGNVPDIIELSGMNVNSYIAQGILTDLAPYMEKDDTVNEDYFIDGLLDKLKVDGKQYYLLKTFNISSIAGKASELSGYKDNWTMDTLIEYYNSKPEKAMLFEDASRQMVFSTLLEQQYDQCVDYSTGEVSFDSGNFGKFIEFCNTFPDEQEVSYDESVELYKMIKNGKLLLQDCILSSIDDITLRNKLFNGDIEYIGYPTPQGGETYISYPSMMLSISSSAKNADAAWEFVKFVYSNDVVKEDVDMLTIPATKPEFDIMLKRATATETYTDEYGNLIEPRSGTLGYDDYSIELEPATEEDINMLNKLIAESLVMVSPAYDAYDIVTEEVNKYFNGERTLDETINILQDKMKKIVNENL